MQESPSFRLLGPLFAPETRTQCLWPRWLFLRALGLIFLSAFTSLAFQIHALIGPSGILPARQYLRAIASEHPGLVRLWYAPTLLWIDAGNGALSALVLIGLAASLMLTVGLWPRGSILICALAFLSFVAAAEEFSNYQSDAMLMEAAFLSLFFAPRGLWPRLGASSPPSRASLFLLQWEWFRIYFESGVGKLASGDPEWRALTAMDHYYENGPLPTWLGWYVQHLPHGFHAATALLTLVTELVLVWALFAPRRFKIACFVLVTALQVGIILTANYAFLNYLVLALGVLLVDDPWLARLRWFPPAADPAAPQAPSLRPWQLWSLATLLSWTFTATVTAYIGRGALAAPSEILEPFRVANRYGLFAVMTPARYEIEFQGSRDGVTWTPYKFRYKPQDIDEAPGIYAPYQPRFEWNLWFASLGSYRDNPWVEGTEVRLLEREPHVLALFRGDPFAGAGPRKVRAILWQYRFTQLATKRRDGTWWQREELGAYGPTFARQDDGTIAVDDFYLQRK